MVIMKNIYLEKIAFQMTDKAVHIASTVGGAALGAGLAGSRKSYKKLESTGDGSGTYTFKEKEFSTKHRIANATFGALAGAQIGYGIGILARPGFTGYKGFQNSGRTHGRNYRSANPHANTSHHDILNKVQAKAKDFTHKDQVNKHFKTHLHRTHPDKHGQSAESVKKFQDLSTARDALQKTEWFQKLAASMHNLKTLAYMRKGRKSYKELARMFNVVQKTKK